MRQCEIWFADLEPTRGSEQAGRRPVVIISGNTLNDALPIVIICPISSKVKLYPTCVTLRANRANGLRKDGEVISFQVRAITKKRLTKRIGRISQGELQDIVKGLFVALMN